MRTRDSYNFKKIVIENESYYDAFDKMTFNGAKALDIELEELMPTERRTPYDFQRAYIIYRRNLLIKEFKEEMRKIKELLVDMDYRHHGYMDYFLKDINNKDNSYGRQDTD